MPDESGQRRHSAKPRVRALEHACSSLEHNSVLNSLIGLLRWSLHWPVCGLCIDLVQYVGDCEVLVDAKKQG